MGSNTLGRPRLVRSPLGASSQRLGRNRLGVHDRTPTFVGIADPLAVARVIVCRGRVFVDAALHGVAVVAGAADGLSGWAGGKSPRDMERHGLVDGMGSAKQNMVVMWSSG